MTGTDELAALTGQLDTTSWPRFSARHRAPWAGFPHGASVADIDGLDARSAPRVLPPDVGVMVRHVDATGDERFLVVKELSGADGLPSQWRSPSAAETVALNVRATGSVTFIDDGVAVIEASVVSLRVSARAGSWTLDG